MKTIELEVVNQSGIHARPSGMIVEVTNRISSDVRMKYNGITANAKSILNIMMLAVEPGGIVQFIIDGEDEEQAAAELTALFEKGFYEEE